jgi:hypothetical protein
VDSVVSATHENRKQSDKTFGEVDAAIGIKKADLEVLNDVLGLDVDSSKTISPSKYIDLALKEVEDTKLKYKNLKDEGNTLSKNTLKANLDVLEALPEIEEIYDTVFQYAEFKKQDSVEEDIMQTGGIPDRYRNKGFTKVGVKKQAPEGSSKKWQVLAKKGDQYKIVSGGYRGMQDFTQHKNKDRQKNFWSRMGGINGPDTKDPFSPLYWTKRGFKNAPPTW